MSIAADRIVAELEEINAIGRAIIASLDRSLADGRLVSRDCNNCGYEGDVEEITDLGGSRWVCPECDEPHDSTEDHDYEDPDAERDRWLDDLS